MSRLLITLLFCLISFFSSKAQLVEYHLIASYSTDDLDSLLSENGIPTTIIPLNKPVNFYKVLYKTPYKYMDSLVTVSGALAIPKGVDCALPLAEYLHGTVAKRTNVPSYLSQEALIGLILASDGYMVGMPDYLGLGDSDPRVIIHPYIHAFSQGHTSVNMLRASRQVADSLGIALNGQIFLTGYSQGGFSTVATHKLIEEEYSNEFNITASAPMSGPYDLKKAQVDLIASDSIYPTPGYLPYILLAYYSVFDNIQQLYPDITKVLKHPYDSIIPPLFYNKNKGMGYINSLCPGVPKHIIKDSLVQLFVSDSLHPLRLALAASDLLDWVPQAPIKLFYCHGDDQVTYLNSEEAYDSWTAKGALHVEKADFGNYDHFNCFQFAILGAKAYFDSYKNDCTTSVRKDINQGTLKIYPNPATDYVMVERKSSSPEYLFIHNLSGQQVFKTRLESQLEVLNLGNLPPGVYVAELKGEITSKTKLVIWWH